MIRLIENNDNTFKVVTTDFTHSITFTKENLLTSSNKYYSEKYIYASVMHEMACIIAYKANNLPATSALVNYYKYLYRRKRLIFVRGSIEAWVDLINDMIITRSSVHKLCLIRRLKYSKLLKE